MPDRTAIRHGGWAGFAAEAGLTRRGLGETLVLWRFPAFSGARSLGMACGDAVFGGTF